MNIDNIDNVLPPFNNQDNILHRRTTVEFLDLKEALSRSNLEDPMVLALKNWYEEFYTKYTRLRHVDIKGVVDLYVFQLEELLKNPIEKEPTFSPTLFDKEAPELLRIIVDKMCNPYSLFFSEKVASSKPKPIEVPQKPLLKKRINSLVSILERKERVKKTTEEKKLATILKYKKDIKNENAFLQKLKQSQTAVSTPQKEVSNFFKSPVKKYQEYEYRFSATRQGEKVQSILKATLQFKQFGDQAFFRIRYEEMPKLLVRSERIYSQEKLNIIVHAVFQCAREKGFEKIAFLYDPKLHGIATELQKHVPIESLGKLISKETFKSTIQNRELIMVGVRVPKDHNPIQIMPLFPKGKLGKTSMEKSIETVKPIPNEESIFKTTFIDTYYEHALFKISNTAGYSKLEKSPHLYSPEYLKRILDEPIKQAQEKGFSKIVISYNLECNLTRKALDHVEIPLKKLIEFQKNNSITAFVEVSVPKN